MRENIYVEVMLYRPAKPWRQHTFKGAGPGDCDPPEEEELEYQAWDNDTGLPVELTSEEEIELLRRLR